MQVSQMTQKLALLAMAATASFGATPVARVIGAQSIEVDGIGVPQGNYTPVSVGNSVSTRSGVAVVQFRDGSNVALEPNSSLKLEGDASAPQVRIIQGMATYTISSKSRLTIVNSRGETLNRLLTKALPEATALTRTNMAIEPAVAFKGSARLPGGVAPTGAVAVGQFSSGTFHATAGGATTITLPNHTVLTLTATTSSTGVVSYTVTGIQTQVTNPVTNQVVFVTVDASTDPGNQLLGATFTPPATTQTGTQTEVNLTFTGTNGQTLNSGQVTAGLNNAAAVGVTEAKQNGTLPPNTTPPTISANNAITQGQFSSTAP
jgi:hypothetical protein